jgi:hypothetical protein
VVVSGTDRDQQLVFFEVDIFIFIKDIDVRGTGFLHIVRLLRANIEQEGGRSTVDETGDTFVHGLFPRCIKRFLVYLLEIGLEETDYAFLWVVDILFPAILFREGVYMKKHLLGGVAKGAFGEAEAEAKFEAWKNNKQSGLAALKAKEEEAKKAEAKARLEAEKKVNEVKAKALAEKKAAEEAAKAAAEAPAEEETEAPAEEAPAAEAAAE